MSVGGTSLFLDQGGRRQSESVWNDNGPRDYCEQAFERPLGAQRRRLQHPVQRQGLAESLSSWNSTGCGSERLDNDVSADADYLTGFDVYDSYNCGDACSPAPGWFTRRRHLAVVADHRRDLRAGLAAPTASATRRSPSTGTGTRPTT